MRHLQDIEEEYGAGRDAALTGGTIRDCPPSSDAAYRAWMGGFRAPQAFDPNCQSCGGDGVRNATAPAAEYSPPSIPCDCNIAAPNPPGCLPLLPEGWVEVRGAFAAALDKELVRELCPAHRLFGQRLIISALRSGRDDFLVCPRSSPHPVYCVHLTWAVEREPTWPWTSRYENVADFVARLPEEEQQDCRDDDEPG